MAGVCEYDIARVPVCDRGNKAKCSGCHYQCDCREGGVPSRGMNVGVHKLKPLDADRKAHVSDRDIRRGEETGPVVFSGACLRFGTPPNNPGSLNACNACPKGEACRAGTEKPVLKHENKLRQAAARGVEKSRHAHKRGRPKGEPKTCSEPGCGRPHVSRGLCKMHYLRLLRAEKRESRV